MLIGIAAVAENQVIGRDNDLVWKLPNDLKRFMKVTTGHPLIMGRRTFDSMKGPLPRRENLVVSRDKNWKAEGVSVYYSLEEAIIAAKKISETVFIIGGGKIYEQALPYLDVLDITLVHNEFEGDTFFPEIKPEEWKEISREFYPKDEKHNYDFSFLRFERIGDAKKI